MAQKMKVAIFVEPDRIALDEKPIPEVGPLDALLRSLGKKLDKPRVSLLKAELEAHADKTHSPRFWAKEVAA